MSIIDNNNYKSHANEANEDSIDINTNNTNNITKKSTLAVATNSSSSSSVTKKNESKSEFNVLDRNRYRNYAHPGQTLREPNYVMQHAAPSMLCLLRKLQVKPYFPLPPERIARTVYPQDYSLRPSPHVAHQALIDFYRACDGHYGVHVEDITAMQLITKQHSSSSNKNNNPNTNNSNNVNMNNNNNSSDQVAGENGVYNINSTNSPVSPDNTETGANSFVNNNANTAMLSKELDEYRLQQFRRSTQHVDSSAHGKVCHYFQTKEGCRRGKYCPFLHLDKDGQPITLEHVKR